MQPKDVISAISTSEKVISSLYRWVSGHKGHKQSIAMEIRENIEVIRLFVESKAGFKELIPNLKEESFRKALEEGFNFNSLKKGKITEKSTRGSRQLAKYIGWDTERVILNLYTKISVLKSAASISDNKASLRLDVRLQNLYRMLIMISYHILES